MKRNRLKVLLDIRLLIVAALLLLWAGWFVFGKAPEIQISARMAQQIDMATFPLPKGAVDWKLFAATHVESQIDMREAAPKLVFHRSLQRLNGKEIMLQGYIFPLSNEPEQNAFLLGPFEPNCPFHYHVSKNLIVYAKAAEPLPYQAGKVLVKGKLELATDVEGEAFYLLHQARFVKG